MPVWCAGINSILFLWERKNGAEFLWRRFPVGRLNRAPVNASGLCGARFFSAPVSALEAFEDVEFFAGAAEEDLDMVDRLVDFGGDVLGGDSGVAGCGDDFCDLGFQEPARGALGGLASFLFCGAAALASGANRIFGEVFLARAEEFDLFFDFLDLRMQAFFFLCQRRKITECLAAEVCYFHGARSSPYFHVARQVFLLDNF